MDNYKEFTKRMRKCLSLMQRHFAELDIAENGEDKYTSRNPVSPFVRRKQYKIDWISDKSYFSLREYYAHFKVSKKNSLLDMQEFIKDELIEECHEGERMLRYRVSGSR